jgi:hypothetical protein
VTPDSPPVDPGSRDFAVLLWPRGRLPYRDRPPAEQASKLPRITSERPRSSLAILLFELTQPLHLRRHQPGVLLAPTVESCLTDPCLAADLANRRALLRPAA